MALLTVNFTVHTFVAFITSNLQRAYTCSFTYRQLVEGVDIRGFTYRQLAEGVDIPGFTYRQFVEGLTFEVLLTDNL